MNNKLCEKCQKKCKQIDQVRLIECPKFVAKPVQLELKFADKTPKKS